MSTTEGPRLTWILGLEKKNALLEIHVSGTVGDTLLTQKSPTCVAKNHGSGIHGRSNLVSGGPPVCGYFAL